MTAEAPAAFADSREHDEFRAVLRDFFAARGGLAAARAVYDDGADPDEPWWSAMATGLALQGLTVREDLGGGGFGRRESAVVAHEMGRNLVGGSFLATVPLAAEALIRADDPAETDALLTEIAAGTCRAALAVCEVAGDWSGPSMRMQATETAGAWSLQGTKVAVLGAASADVLVVVAREGGGALSLFVVHASAPGVAVTPLEVLDRTRPMGEVRLDAAPARRIGRPDAGASIVRDVLDGAAIFLAAEQAGAAEACIERTTQYARDRIQFGQPIGRFQGVKHRLADMAVRQEQALAVVEWAAAQTPGGPQARCGAAIARSWTTEHLSQTAFDMVQLHGGIAITWEHDAHLFLRRAQATAGLLPSPQAMRSELVDYVGRDVTDRSHDA